MTELRQVRVLSSINDFMFVIINSLLNTFLALE